MGGKFWPFVYAVARHWWFLLAIAFAVIRLIPAIKTGPIPQWVYWLGMTVCLFVAFFRAWRDESDKADFHKREADEMYADVVLGFLMEHHVKSFPVNRLAEMMEYDQSKALRGLETLQKEFQVVSNDGAIGWSFDFEKAFSRGLHSNLRRAPPPEKRVVD